MDANRLATARLFQRFGFGARPGEFSAALGAGFSNTRTNLLTPPGVDNGAQRVRDPGLTDLGRRPDPKDPLLPMFAAEMKEQNKSLSVWWLDRMETTGS